MQSTAWIIREVSIITVRTTALRLHSFFVLLVHPAEEDPVRNVCLPLPVTKSSITESKSSNSLKLKLSLLQLPVLQLSHLLGDGFSSRCTLQSPASQDQSQLWPYP